MPPSVVAGIGFIGRSEGALKRLRGFRKSHHSVPDTASAAAQAFLGRLCAEELAEQGEALFQQVRTDLGYKRMQVSLSVTSPVANLQARDFSVEIAYALKERDPACYTLTTTLRDLRSADLLHGAAFAGIFAGRFTEIAFALKKGVPVEAVVDAIENLDGRGGLRVDYPSDCRDCTISVEGVDATVRCTGASLEIVFPRAGGPADLVEAFGVVREAFQINRLLRGLIV